MNEHERINRGSLMEEYLVLNKKVVKAMGAHKLPIKFIKSMTDYGGRLWNITNNPMTVHSAVYVVMEKELHGLQEAAKPYLLPKTKPGPKKIMNQSCQFEKIQHALKKP